MKPLVYYAGPITSPNPMHNVNLALSWAGTMMAEAPVVFFVPHLTVLWDMIEPRDYEWWLAYDFDVILRCQALYRAPGVSPGADREVEHAHLHGIPVFTRFVDLRDWAVGGLSDDNTEPDA